MVMPAMFLFLPPFSPITAEKNLDIFKSTSILKKGVCIRRKCSNYCRGRGNQTNSRQKSSPQFQRFVALYMHAKSCGEFHDRYQMNAISTCVSYSCSIQISQTNMRPYPYSHTSMYSPDSSGAVEAALRPNQAAGNHRSHDRRKW